MGRRRRWLGRTLAPCISLTRNETYGLARPRLRFGAIASLRVAMPDKRRVPVKFRQIKRASMQNAQGSTSTSQNRQRPSAATHPRASQEDQANRARDALYGISTVTLKKRLASFVGEYQALSIRLVLPHMV